MEDIQARYDRFMVLVKRLRHYQDAFELYKGNKDKNNLIRYQREIDKWITEELSKTDKTNQQEIFK